jgi:Ca-activated chloride channel homolog
MMYFERSDYLFLIGILLVLILAWLLNQSRQIKISALLGERRLVKKLAISSPLPVQIAKYSLFLLGLLFMIIGLAKPYVLGVNQHSRNMSPTDIVFVVDVSKSMYVKDVAPDRISRARHLVQDIIGQLSSEQVGIVLFSGKANTYMPLTDDYYYVKKSVDAISGDLVVQKGTSLQEALRISSLIYGSDVKKTKVMCLISDGEFHDGNAIAIADSIRKSGIKLFCFGMGTVEGAEVPATYSPVEEEFERDKNNNSPIISHMHPEELARIAGNKPNTYFQTADKLNAASLFADQLRNLEFSEVTTTPKPYYSLFLLIALIFLIAEACIPQVVKPHNVNEL